MARIKYASAVRKCVFCKYPAELGKGSTLFTKDGSPTYYCSRKCERNAEMKRNPRKKKWASGKVKQ